MISYSFNNELGIIDVKTEGTLVANDVKDYYKSLPQDDSLPIKLITLIDARDTHFNIEHFEVEDVFSSTKNACDKFISIKEAIIVDKPNETAIAIMFQKFSDDFDNYNFAVFSTKGAALKWLKTEQ